MKLQSKSLVILMLMLVGWMPVQAEDARLKPFLLASQTVGELGATVDAVKGKLIGNGFDLAGTYTPYENTVILVVTNDAMKQAAAKSEFGGYGAAQRVSITKVKDEIQVAYTNPVYMANAYRMADDLSGVAGALEAALGRRGEFGSDKGITAQKLRKYHYKIFMPYFDDPRYLAKHGSYKDAVKAVEDGLAAGKYGATKVYRIDIPGKQETVFGVALKKVGQNGDKYMDDQYIMSEVDFKNIKSTAHLPYELLVSGNQVYMLSAKFRIAIDFPDLSMMGKNSFMNIMNTPAAIEKALALTAGTTREF